MDAGNVMAHTLVIFSEFKYVIFMYGKAVCGLCSYTVNQLTRETWHVYSQHNYFKSYNGTILALKPSVVTEYFFFNSIDYLTRLYIPYRLYAS